jgi:thiol-disulfide isomerase/thioredoxin
MVLAILILVIFVIGAVMFIICNSKSPFESMGTSEKPKISKDSVLIFFAPWCGYCKKAKDEFETAVKDGGGDIHLIDSTDPDNTDLVKKYDITSFPTIIKGDGKTKYEGDRFASEIVAFKNKK